MENILKTLPNTVTLVDKDNLFAICTAGVLVQGGAATDAVVGVITKGGLTYSDVCLFGKTKVIVGGTVAIGDRLTSTTGGKALKATTGARQEVAIALEAGVSGDVIEIMFYGLGYTGA